MNIGDIVRTTRELIWIDDRCEAGTRLRLTRHRVTNSGIRWTGITKCGHTHYNIPEEDIEVIA